MTTAAGAERLRFAGHEFEVKAGRGLGPGPNDWSSSQAFIDGKGRLHLKLSPKNGRWVAGEASSVERFGFGVYEIEYEGDIEALDPNVVFGFFNYPTADVGPDATREIDVEFARWGERGNRALNYTVWPVEPGRRYGHRSLDFFRSVRRSLHRFVWSRKSVAYESVELDRDGRPERRRSWTFRPDKPGKSIAAEPMPIHFNLWAFRGRPPTDGKPVEVVVRRFSFTPAK